MKTSLFSWKSRPQTRRAGIQRSQPHAAALGLALCLVAGASAAQAQSVVLVLVGNISAPTCPFAAAALPATPGTATPPVPVCQRTPTAVAPTDTPALAQVSEAALPGKPAQKRVVTVVYW